jgi:hypothetical protein
MATMKKAKGGYVLEHNGATIIYKTKREAEQALLRVTLGSMGIGTDTDKEAPKETKKMPREGILTEGEDARKLEEDEQRNFESIMRGKARGFVLYVNMDNGEAVARISRASKEIVMASIPTLLRITTPDEGAKACVAFIKGVQHADAHAKGECGEHDEE